MKKLTVLLALAAPLVQGCFFLPSWDDDYTYEEESDPYVYEHTIDAQVEDAWIGGDMRDLGQFEGDAYEATYYGSNLTLHAGENGGADFGWAMISLSTYEEGGFEGEAYQPGTTHNSNDEPGLRAQGCTGPAHGNYIYDGYADVVEIEVEEGPTDGSRLFHYHAVYEGQGDIEGSFVLY